MIVTFQLPDEVIRLLDELFKRPAWPFPDRMSVQVWKLSPDERKVWDEYIARDAAVPKTRSAVLRQIVTEYIESKVVNPSA